MNFAQAADKRLLLRAMAGESHPRGPDCPPLTHCVQQGEPVFLKTAGADVSQVEGLVSSLKEHERITHREKGQLRELLVRAHEREKAAGVLGAVGGVARGVGRGANWAWQKSMKHNGAVMGTVGLGLGAAGLYALGKHEINRTRATYQGFNPEVQAYTRQSPY